MKKRGLGVVMAFVVTFSATFFPIEIAKSVSLTVAGEKGEIVIDAGHGGIDGGVSGKISKVKESELNLDVAQKIESVLRGKAISCVMTRKDSDGLYGLPVKGFKKRDLAKRKEIIESSQAKIVVSVHMNACPYPYRRGAQVFYKIGSEKSKELAVFLQNKLNRLPEYIKKSNPLAGDFFILNSTDKVAVLVECGFLSNEEDETLLNTEEFRRKIASVIADGLFSFLLEKNYAV